jgi:two-component system sensor histidine kinase/response regulator
VNEAPPASAGPATPAAPEPASPAPQPRRRGLRLAAAPFVLVLVGSALLGSIPYRLEVSAARHELQRKVAAVGRLKAREVASWLVERRRFVTLASMGPRIALDLETGIARARVDAEARAWAEGRLRRIAATGEFDAAAFLGLDGALLAATGGFQVDAQVAELARRALAERTALLSPLRRIERGGTDALAIDVAAPLLAVDERGTRTVGVTIGRVDPRWALFPLVQSWPTDSPSAESLVVTREGDQVLFLNDLRHRKETALRLRLPVADRDLIASRAVRGERGVVEGVDYRGIPVLADVEPIEGTDWLLVSKIDQVEAYAPLRDYFWGYGAFLALAAVTAGAAARMRVRREREEGLRREHEETVRRVDALVAARAERERLIASLQKALDEVKTLSGIVPICAACKRIRDDEGYWSQVEAYVSRHTEARFSHGICPECAARLYPGLITPAPPGPER